MRGLRELAPVFPERIDGGRRAQPNGQRAAGENRREALHQRRLAGKRRRQAALSLRVVVRQRQRQHGASGLDRRLQQRRVKAQEVGAVGRRPLGEDRHINAAAEQRVDLSIDHLGVAAAAAAQENGVVARGEPADKRPAADLCLGDEGRRAQRVDHEDIEPGDMVGDDQTARRRVVRLRVEANAQDVENLLRPALLEACPCGSIKPRVERDRAQRYPGKIERQPQAAQNADQPGRGGHDDGCACGDGGWSKPRIVIAFTATPRRWVTTALRRKPWQNVRRSAIGSGGGFGRHGVRS